MIWANTKWKFLSHGAVLVIVRERSMIFVIVFVLIDAVNNNNNNTVTHYCCDSCPFTNANASRKPHLASLSLLEIR